MNAFRAALESAGLEAQVIGHPTVFDVVFTGHEIVDFRSWATGDAQRVQQLNALLLAHGVFRGDSKFYISLAHSQEDVERTIKAFQTAISMLT